MVAFQSYYDPDSSIFNAKDLNRTLFFSSPPTHLKHHQSLVKSISSSSECCCSFNSCRAYFHLLFHYSPPSKRKSGGAPSIFYAWAPCTSQDASCELANTLIMPSFTSTPQRRGVPDGHTTYPTYFSNVFYKRSLHDIFLVYLQAYQRLLQAT
jgi:hypothetical protein